MWHHMRCFDLDADTVRGVRCYDGDASPGTLHVPPLQLREHLPVPEPRFSRFRFALADYVH